MKGKKGYAEYEKVIRHLVVYGKFKNYKEVEGSNVRVNRKIDEMYKQRILIKDSQGYYHFNYGKYPLMDTMWKDILLTLGINITDEKNKKILKNLKLKKSFVDEIIKTTLELQKQLKK